MGGNKEFIVDIAYSRNSQKDLDGFFVGSENGYVFRYTWSSGRPVDCLQVDEDGATADLLLAQHNSLFVSGRGWTSLMPCLCGVCLSTRRHTPRLMHAEFPLDRVTSAANLQRMEKLKKCVSASLQDPYATGGLEGTD